MNRRVLLETLEDELPRGTIRYCSKVVRIECEDRVKSIHLADGTVLKTKVNSVLNATMPFDSTIGLQFCFFNRF